MSFLYLVLSQALNFLILKLRKTSPNMPECDRRQETSWKTPSYRQHGTGILDRDNPTLIASNDHMTVSAFAVSQIRFHFITQYGNAQFPLLSAVAAVKSPEMADRYFRYHLGGL